MPKRTREKKREQRQRQWEMEKARAVSLSGNAAAAKKVARKNGFAYRFFEALDSDEFIFQEIVKDARKQYPSLVNVVEVSDEDFEEADGTKYGIAPEWKRVVFNDETSAASTYNDPDPNANIRGAAFAYTTPEGLLRTLVLIPARTNCGVRLADCKYHFKQITLLHELGHVQDFEREVNFKIGPRTVDIVAAEVYANLHALNEANRLGIFTAAETLASALEKYIGESEYRGEVARRVLAAYKTPEVTRWGDLIGV